MKNKKDMLIFLLLAFLIPLLCVIIMNVFSSNGVLNFILYGIEGATPAIATIVTIFIVSGKNGLKDFLHKKYVDNISIKYIVIGLLIPVLTLTITKIIVVFINTDLEFISIITGKKMIIVLWALIAEELGWRGFLQERVEESFSIKITPIIVGIVWTMWHYHFFISGSMEVPIVYFLIGCVTESMGYYVLTRLAKGNVVPASVWHCAGNLFFNLYRIDPKWNNGSLMPYTVFSIVCLVYVIIFWRYCVNMQKDEN